MQRDASCGLSTAHFGAFHAHHADKVCDVFLCIVISNQRKRLVLFFERREIADLSVCKFRAHPVIASFGYVASHKGWILRRSRPNLSSCSIEFS